MVILEWFVDHDVAESAMSGYLIREDVEVQPETIYSLCLDENVHIESCHHKYFSHDAWISVQAVIEVLRSNPVWYYGLCLKLINDESESSVMCDSCLT